MTHPYHPQCGCATRRHMLGWAALASIGAITGLTGLTGCSQADWNAPKGHWIDAKTAVYVVGGKRHGSMGPTIGSFAQEADAKKFAGEYGGKVLRFAEITPAMVDLSGGALHDTRM